MAAKAKVTPKGKVKPVAKQQSKVKAKPKGLQLSAAQWKAYNKAYTATRTAAFTRLALARAVNRFRKYRLQAAYATEKQFAVYNVKVKAAAVAAYATRRSYQEAKLAHQTQALRSRVEMDMYNHQNLLGRLQFGQAGERAYVNRAVMRTVDTSQATTYEEKVFAAAARIAKRSTKSVKKAKTKTPISKQQKAAIAASAAAAGLKAAKATARGKTAKVKPAAAKRGRPKGKAAASKKAPVVQPKKRTALKPGLMRPITFDGGGLWVGGNNEFDPTCVMTAVANAMLDQLGLYLPDEDIAYWTGRFADDLTIPHVLAELFRLQPWPEVRLHQSWWMREWELPPCMPCILGFKTPNGDHAAYCIGDRVISWGEDMGWPEQDPVEEVWTCKFDRR